jgi:hypothetical protein
MTCHDGEVLLTVQVESVSDCTYSALIPPCTFHSRFGTILYESCHTALSSGPSPQIDFPFNIIVFADRQASAEWRQKG